MTVSERYFLYLIVTRGTGRATVSKLLRKA